MAKEPTPATEAEANGAMSEEDAPSLNTLAQYVKDLSFENPHAPMSLQVQDPNDQPQINIGVNVNASTLSDVEYEVVLKIEAEAKGKENVLFNVELTYAGVFRITGVPEDSIHPVVLIECPRLLFPFARQIIAEATRNGGFPPLMIDPVDFAALFQQRVAEAQAEAETAGNA